MVPNVSGDSFRVKIPNPLSTGTEGHDDTNRSISFSFARDRGSASTMDKLSRI